MNNLKNLVERKLTPTSKSGEDIIYKCPKCGHTSSSGKLWVNYRKNKFHCFKCNWGGNSLIPLLETLGIDIRFDYDSLDMDVSKELDSVIGISSAKKKRVVDYSRSLKVLNEYYKAHVAPLSAVARDYLNRRGITDYLIERYQMMEGLNRLGSKIIINGKEYQGRDYSGRIMVPSLRKDGTISFYLGRDYSGTKKNRYVNCPSELAYSSEDVWNLERVESEHVIICEGIMTAITAGGIKCNAVATYGKSISAKSNTDSELFEVTCQGEKLLNKKFKSYYIAYDADARVSALNTARYLYERGARVFIVNIDPAIYGEKADVNDIGYNEFLKLLSEAKLYDRFYEVDNRL